MAALLSEVWRHGDQLIVLLAKGGQQDLHSAGPLRTSEHLMVFQQWLSFMTC